MNSDRAVLIGGGGIVTLAFIVLQLNLSSEWLIFGAPIPLAMYVLFAKIDKGKK